MTNDDIATFTGAFLGLMIVPTFMLFRAGTKASKTWLRVFACLIPLAVFVQSWDTREAGLFLGYAAACLVICGWAVRQHLIARHAPPTI